jgi:hypothetical protein
MPSAKLSTETNVTVPQNLQCLDTVVERGSSWLDAHQRSATDLGAYEIQNERPADGFTADDR